MRTIILAISALVIATPAMAQPQSGSGASVATGQANLPEGSAEAGTTAEGQRKVCRRIPTESSSRMSLRRVCLTTREWREFDRNNR